MTAFLAHCCAMHGQHFKSWGLRKHDCQRLRSPLIKALAHGDVKQRLQAAAKDAAQRGQALAQVVHQDR